MFMSQFCDEVTLNVFSLKKDMISVYSRKRDKRNQMINTSDSCQGAPKTESKVQKNISMLWLFGQVCFGQKIKLERMWGFIDFCTCTMTTLRIVYFIWGPNSAQNTDPILIETSIKWSPALIPRFPSHIYCKLKLHSAETSVKRTRTPYYAFQLHGHFYNHDYC